MIAACAADVLRLRGGFRPAAQALWVIWVPLTLPRRRAGWSYLSGERPSLNVPYSVLALEPTLQNNNVCRTTVRARFSAAIALLPPS